MKESAMYKVWDNNTLIDLFIHCPTATSVAPTREEEELVRIFKEHRQLQAENERLKEEIGWLKDFIKETDSFEAYRQWRNCNTKALRTES